VASPHYLASGVGLGVLASGGNAVDAAVATNLALGVVMPRACGYGGDLFALVWRDGLLAYNGSGRAPRGATVERVAALAGAATMPARGPLSVTVPGAVEGWFALLDRFGSRTFGELAGPALRYAGEGVPLTGGGAALIAEMAGVFDAGPAFAEWRRVYGGARAGERLRQPGLARTIETLARDGPRAFYEGPIAEAVVAAVGAAGGLLAPEDLAGHRGEWMAPLVTAYRGVEVVELPPNTQGVGVALALNILEGHGPLPPGPADRQHLMIEAVKLALEDVEAHVGDPAAMRVRAADLASRAWADRRRRLIDMGRARRAAPQPAPAGGTVYVCASDRTGLHVSLIQSNFTGFGSGITVPGWGVSLQNRGASFSLEAGHPNAVGPGKRPLHTLIPAMALREGRPWLVFGTMGGRGQAQTHVQLLARVVDDGEDIQRAIDAPRWLVAEDGAVTVEGRFDGAVVEALRARGHPVRVAGDFEFAMGHAHAIEVRPEGYAGATDPRAEGAALGL
jgi:gamma-glutamyltranspeptidase/glutathione hydrolase